MRLLASIFKSALFYIMAPLLLSSETMKEDDRVINIPMAWKYSTTHMLSIDGATYPEEYNGLPLVSVPLVEEGISDVRISGVHKTALLQIDKEELNRKFPANSQLTSLRRLRERGDERVFLDIFPIQYDSAKENYFIIDRLEVELIHSPNKPHSSNLRTGEDGSNSVLATGDWYKIPVISTGIYKIDYDYLKSMGVNASAVDPRKIKIYGNGGGMLPQKNNAPRPNDLVENAIEVMGESDGTFDKHDFILFYGQEADHKKLSGNGELEYQKNYYSDTSYYFLTISGENGSRVSERENLGLDQPRVRQFDDFITYEKDEINIINSGREWYGEKFDFTLTYDFTFDFSDLVPGTELSVTSAIMGQTYQEASMDVFVNGKALGQQPVHSIVEGTYLAKGSNQIETFNINTSAIPSPEKFTVRLSFNPVGSGRSKANLNYLTVLGKRKLKLYENQTMFRSLESTDHAISTFEIGDAGSVFRIWDVTDAQRPHRQKFSTQGNAALFGAISAELREFIVFKDQGYLIPEKAVKIANQNLHASPNVDFLIVTHPTFESEAERLADLRRSHDGLDVFVVTTQEIYNEFSSGKQDATAIRDFIKYVYDLGDENSRLQNVLLFGRGSFDYKNRIDDNTNFVPIYTSRNSLHPINSYSSDDYYGFLDAEEGEWRESYSGDHLMDIGVGRLPVKSAEEAQIMVDKLIRYAIDLTSFGHWRNDVLFIADDGDGNLHQRDAEKLADLVDTTYTQFNVNKIYIDAYEQTKTSIGESAPDVNKDIERYIDKGGLIFNYTGHGSVTRWASETILNISSVSEFENKDRLPLFVTATCEFGRHDNPKAISGAEYLLLNPNGGAIGLLTTARPVFSSTNFILNTAFYHNVFKKEEGKYLSIGEIFRRTKNQSLNGSVNRNFSLLADPSMTLAYAKDEIILTADQDAYQPGDTLSALSTVKLKGQVLNAQGQINPNFNGELTVTVFDIPSEVYTFGYEDPVMKFFQRDNIIFRGRSSVKTGEFEVEFIVPRNITFDFEKGKMNMYAVDKSNMLDAAGSNIEFVVGGESEDYIPDNTPPEIEMFINDTSFVNGGITGPDILLVAKLSDESGISISNSERGEELTASLDEGDEIVVNDYYISAVDTYKEGWVTYPYKDLSIGAHKIRLRAWDVHNNQNEAEVEFMVVEDEHIAIEKLMNYPNPFNEFTRFSFEHNRAGDDLEIVIDVYSTQGKLVKQFVYKKENSEARVTDLVWDGREKNGSKLLSGVYVFRLSIRSLNDGSKKQANQKLVIIN